MPRKSKKVIVTLPPSPSLPSRSSEEEFRGCAVFICLFFVFLVLSIIGLIIVSFNQKNILKEKLAKRNQNEPTVIVKEIFVDVISNNKHHWDYNRCIVEEPSGQRYIIEIDKNNIPVTGEKWRVEFYDMGKVDEEIVPRLISKVE